MLFDYVDGGSYAETTMRRNVADFDGVALRQRVMCDTTSLDLSIETFGQSWSMPVGLCPLGMAGLLGRRGEVQAARAAAAAGSPFCLSTMALCSVEEIARHAPAPWFQLYMLKDRGYVRALIERARAAGSPVLVFTVDLAAPGARYRDVRSGMTSPPGAARSLRRAWQGATHPGWLWDVWLRGRPHRFGSMNDAVPNAQGLNDYLAWIGSSFDPAVTWADLDWVRQTWDRPIIIKGILDVDDAREAVRLGADGVMVSNHGGRQLDGVSSSIKALPRIVEAVGGELEVFMDGGVRSGLDVLKALALGARGCFIGRPWAYALSAGGERYVSRMLATMRAELTTAMVLTGCRTVREAGRTLLDAANWT
jgi:L-lactate dehydrogenase (cytochrome)